MFLIARDARLVLGLAMLAGACTANPQAKPEGDAAPAKQEAAPVVSQAPVKVEPAMPAMPATPSVTPPVPTTPTTQEIPPVIADGGVATPPVVAGEAGMPVATLPPAVAAESIEHRQPAWELVAKLDKEVELERLARGVLVHVGGVMHEAGPDGGLVENLSADDPEPGKNKFSAVKGRWPDDAWRVKEVMHGRSGYDLTFFKWRSNNRWVAQSVDGENKWDSDVVVAMRWSPRTGFLVAERKDDGQIVLERIAGSYPAPEPMNIGRGYLQDAFESVGGTVFLFVTPDAPGGSSALEILRSCKPEEPPGCERSGGLLFKEPGEKGAIQFGEMVARSRWSISVAIRAALEAGNDEMDDHYLLHHDTGGWKLEAVPGDMRVRQMLGTLDGGLWVVLDDGTQQTPWHRSNAGKWVAVDLPAELAGAKKIGLALRDAKSMWVAGNVGDVHAIYAAPAAVQAPVVVTPEPSPAG